MSFPPDKKTHFKHLKAVFQALINTGLALKPDKCSFFAREFDVFGHTFKNGTITPSDTHVKAIKDLQPPTTVTQLRSLLGKISYLRRYVYEYALKADPLYHLLTKDMVTPDGKIIWNQQAQNCLDELKSILTSSPVLKTPNATGIFQLTTDASAKGLAAILTQTQPDGTEGIVG